MGCATRGRGELPTLGMFVQDAGCLGYMAQVPFNTQMSWKTILPFHTSGSLSPEDKYLGVLHLGWCMA